MSSPRPEIGRYRDGLHAGGLKHDLYENLIESPAEAIIQLAQDEFPDRHIKMTPTALLYLIVSLMEGLSKIRGIEPELQRNYLTEFRFCEQCKRFYWRKRPVTAVHFSPARAQFLLVEHTIPEGRQSIPLL